MFALTLQECDQVCLPAQLAVDAVSSAFTLVLQVVLDDTSHVSEQAERGKCRRPIAVYLNAVDELCGILIVMLGGKMKIVHRLIAISRNIFAVKIDFTETAFGVIVAVIRGYLKAADTCAVTGYKYQPFHQKVTDFLQNAEYPFLYYCRSTPSKSDNAFHTANAEHIMRMKLGQYFMNKGYNFQKVRLDNDTELMISNRWYDANTQFQWTSMEQKIL